MDTHYRIGKVKPQYFWMSMVKYICTVTRKENSLFLSYQGMRGPWQYLKCRKPGVEPKGVWTARNLEVCLLNPAVREKIAANKIPRNFSLATRPRYISRSSSLVPSTLPTNMTNTFRRLGQLLQSTWNLIEDKHPPFGNYSMKLCIVRFMHVNEFNEESGDSR